MSYSRLTFKVDNGYSTVQTDIDDPSLDPCQSDKPLFSCVNGAGTTLTDANCITHAQYELSTLFGSNNYNTFVDHVWVYRFMYFVMYVEGDKSNLSNLIIRITGVPSDINNMSMNVHYSGIMGSTTQQITSL